MAKGDVPRVATILDVAAAAGVSRTTVSRYLSQQFSSMSPATRARIDRAVNELNYRPSRLARGLRQDKSFTLGFVVPDITNPFAISVLRGAESVAEKRGYMLMVCNSDRDPVKERRYLDVLRSYAIDGLLLFTTGHNDEVVRELASGSVPIVLVDQDVQGAELDLVGSDNVKAVDDAVNHLIEAGYDDVAYFTDVIGSTASRAERANVFRSRLSMHANVAARIFEADVRDDAQLDAQLDAFLSEPRGRKRCLFAGHGVMMLRLYSRLKDRGLRIAEDVSLLGFDDDEWARSAEPPLTTISQSTRDIGARAAELLIEHISGSIDARTVTRLPTRLVVRQSTRPVDGL